MARKLPFGSKRCVHCNGSGLQFDHVAVGRAMRKKREQKQLKATRVADLMGMDPTYLSGLENGKRPWSKETVARYEDALGGISYRDRVVEKARAAERTEK